MVSQRTREFIESAVNLIENEDYYALMKNAYDLGLYNFLEVDELMEELDIDVEPAKLELMGELIVDSINLHIAHPEWDDGSRGWSRLRYVLDGIGMLGLDFDVIVGYLLLNEKALGLNITPLSVEYSWNGGKEYDLGWFKKDKYEEIYF